jgi:hypothetical protein
MNQTASRTHWELFRSFLSRRRTFRGTLRDLIREEETAVGYERNDIRARAKEWLIAHGSSLGAKEIQLAQEHFGYLLPLGWELG